MRYATQMHLRHKNTLQIQSVKAKTIIITVMVQLICVQVGPLKSSVQFKTLELTRNTNNYLYFHSGECSSWIYYVI